MAGLVTVPGVASARDALPVEPTSQWVLDYGDQYCSLARTFGTGETAATLRIKSFGSWNSFDTFLAGPLVPRTQGPFGAVRIAFPPDSEKRDPISAVQGTADGTNAVSFRLYFGPYDPWYKGKRLLGDDQMRFVLEQDRPRPEFDQKVDGVSFDFDNAPPIHLHLQNMAAPLAALRACVDNLYMSWGLDPILQKGLSRRPKPLPLTVAELQRHYPAGHIGRLRNAVVRVMLKIDAAGQPASCAVQNEPADEAFRNAVCEHLTGSFEPARDKDGHPVEAVYFTSVVFLGI